MLKRVVDQFVALGHLLPFVFRKLGMPRASFCAFLCVSGWLLTHGLSADEFSILRNSTVIGRNFGIPPVIEFDREVLVDGIFVRQVEAGDLSLIAEVDFFAKNLELTGSPNIDGETFFGYAVPIRLNYLASDQVQIELGAFLGRNYGDDDSLDNAEPLARVIYQPLPSMFGIAGSLIQTHWIHDGLWDDVFLFRDAQESGLQFRSDLERLKADYWINWRVRETEIRSEQFDGAGANQLRFGQLWLMHSFSGRIRAVKKMR